MPTPHTQGEKHDFGTGDGPVVCKKCGFNFGELLFRSPAMPMAPCYPTPTQEPNNSLVWHCHAGVQHEVGCPHQVWTAEQLQDALLTKKRFEQTYLHKQEQSHQPSEGWDWEKVFDEMRNDGEHATIDDEFLNTWDVTMLKDIIRVLLATARREEREELRGKVERIKLDMDVVVCDCGKPYKDSDPADLVNELLASLTQKKGT